MKLADLKRYLRRQGCASSREGGSHAVWVNPAARKITSGPCDRETKAGTGADDGRPDMRLMEEMT